MNDLDIGPILFNFFGGYQLDCHDLPNVSNIVNIRLDDLLVIVMLIIQFFTVNVNKFTPSQRSYRHIFIPLVLFCIFSFSISFMMGPPNPRLYVFTAIYRDIGRFFCGAAFY